MEAREGLQRPAVAGQAPKPRVTGWNWEGGSWGLGLGHLGSTQLTVPFPLTISRSPCSAAQGGHWLISTVTQKQPHIFHFLVCLSPMSEPPCVQSDT